ncbi:MAG: glycosyltransferase family 2 protein [Candidatus Lindowbacteria bacterium]|nr:glycosyltransferase family 2 protein [Candidatus Lindowbacteria bacterium]
MKLAVVVPVLNEGPTLRLILDRVLAVEEVSEVVVVDDGSTDDTTEVIASYGDRIKSVRHETNMGKGMAVRSGLAVVKSEVVVIQDGDLEYDPADFKKLFEKITSGADVVYGSRILGDNKFSYLRFYFGGRVLSVISNLLYGLSITDEPTCYKMAKMDVMRKLDLECTGFEFCPEMTAKIARMKIPIAEVPISYSPRSLDEGKKIGWWDGVIAVWTLAKFRFWKPKGD